MKKYETFSGVFLPTFLTILSAILFLRMGIIIEGVGLFGAFLIILLSVSVTLSTALSLSSLVTNMKVGEGGAFSIISKTLGLEVGGSIGIPLYFSQIFAVGFYLIAFKEGWLYLFPQHTPILILLGSFVTLLLFTGVSKNFAMRSQYVIFGVICLSLLTVLSGNSNRFLDPITVSFRNSGGDHSFWFYLSIFFPAVTGLMAGVGLSGELRDGKQQIPHGILSAIGVTTVIYLVIVWWLGTSNTVPLSDPYALIILSGGAIPVVIGLLCASFSSALVLSVAAPRLLLALSQKNLIPFSKLLKQKNLKNQPQNAYITSMALIFLLLIIGQSLDVIAQVLTIFFLITYAVINITVLIEKTIKLVSFRPLFKINRLISLYGTLSSFLLIFLISPSAGLLATISIVALYFSFVRKKLGNSGGIMSSLVELLSRSTNNKNKLIQHIRIPHFFYIVGQKKGIGQSLELIKSLILPRGVLSIVGLNITKKTEEYIEHFQAINTKGFVNFSTVQSRSPIDGIIAGIGAVSGQLYPPNILYIDHQQYSLNNTQIQHIMNESKSHSMGFVYAHLPLSSKKTINKYSQICYWLEDTMINNSISSNISFDLALLLGYNLSQGTIEQEVWVHTNEEMIEHTLDYLSKLNNETRFTPLKKFVTQNTLSDEIHKKHKDCLHIVAIDSGQHSLIHDIIKQNSRKSILFIADGGTESVFA